MLFIIIDIFDSQYTKRFWHVNSQLIKYECQLLIFYEQVWYSSFSNPAHPTSLPQLRGACFCRGFSSTFFSAQKLRIILQTKYYSIVGILGATLVNLTFVWRRPPFIFSRMLAAALLLHMLCKARARWAGSKGFWLGRRRQTVFVLVRMLPKYYCNLQIFSVILMLIIVIQTESMGCLSEKTILKFF